MEVSTNFCDELCPVMVGRVSKLPWSRNDDEDDDASSKDKKNINETDHLCAWTHGMSETTVVLKSR